MGIVLALFGVAISALVFIWLVRVAIDSSDMAKDIAEIKQLLVEQLRRETDPHEELPGDEYHTEACPGCGARIRVDSNECWSCGLRLRDS